jgi:hypothetical protein
MLEIAATLFGVFLIFCVGALIVGLVWGAISAISIDFQNHRHDKWLEKIKKGNQ